jgi:hypothetical protein
MHWDGLDFTQVDSGSATLRGIWALAPDRMWAAGDSGVIYWDGTAWADRPGTTWELQAVWAESEDAVFAVGGQRSWFGGLTEVWDGRIWTDQQWDGFETFTGVWGLARNSVWAVGEGSVLFWDGAAWSVEVEGLSTSLEAIWGTREAAFIAGSGGAVLSRELRLRD